MPRIAAALAVVITVASCIGLNTLRYPVVLEMVAEAHHLPRSDKADQPEPTRPSFGFSESEETLRSESAGAYLAGSEFSGTAGAGDRYPGAVEPIPFGGAPDPGGGDPFDPPRLAMADAAAPGDPIRPLASRSRRDAVWNPLANRAEPQTSGEGEPAVDSPAVGYSGDGYAGDEYAGGEYAGEGPVAAAASSKYGFGPVAGTPNEPVEPESDRLSASISRRPLVPVDSTPETVRSPKKERTAFNAAFDFRFPNGESDDEDGAKVRRLPAVDNSLEPPQGLAGAASPDGRIPIYPLTGRR